MCTPSSSTPRRLQLPNVGKVRTLSIGHNNKGPGPEWHLEMVELLDEEAEVRGFGGYCFHGPKLAFWELKAAYQVQG